MLILIARKLNANVDLKREQKKKECDSDKTLSVQGMLQIDVMQKKYVCMYACMLNCVDTPFFCTNNICIVYIVYQHNIGIKK